ncbi:hypothetical protein AM228_26015 [Planktothricoides sp. SR001]|uniref:hypothetical protein n=1 Tax=Planktothricoides sp. SR001 TaxID=1705388 RepID=UPI0006C25489|nr:hypothetical protein [Planktothricoides sp. SR001]KOR34121.1 hypothetical protein AM228_26015 [Planktothricoides sp. SR001]
MRAVTHHFYVADWQRRVAADGGSGGWQRMVAADGGSGWVNWQRMVAADGLTDGLIGSGWWQRMG